MRLSIEIIDSIDGGDENRGTDSRLTRWHDQAALMERAMATLVLAADELLSMPQSGTARADVHDAIQAAKAHLL